MRVSRVDTTGKFDSSRRTPQGGLRLPAYLTRVGVLRYAQPDGSIVAELRPPEEVFKADSLASLEGAPVTVGHPGKVAPENYRNHSVGHVGDTVKQEEEKYVGATLRIQDAKAVQAVEKGELLELSCGYDCDASQESGEWNGEHYDAVQRNIVYNHVALLPRGAGRAGQDVKLRLDGVTYTLVEAMDEKLAALTAENAALKAKAETERNDAKSTLDKVTAERDALKTRVDALETAANDTKAFDAAVAARVKLHQDAAVVKVDPAGKTPREIHLAALGSAFENRSDAYLEAAFDMAVEAAKKATVSVAAVRKTAEDAATSVPAESPVDAARKRHDERSKNAWKKAV